jgi:peptide/nickel transport system substrate-binding protein
VDRVEAIHLHEVKLALIAPRSDAVRLLTTQVPILPEAVWRGAEHPLRVSNLENPIGSGPFRLVAFLPGERVILENTGNHHSLRPSVQSVVVEIVRDEDRALEMLQNAELDGIGWSIAPHLVRSVLDDPETYAGIRVAQAPDLVVQTLLLNLRKTPYDDPAFRRAIALAINVEDMVERVLLGLGGTASAGLFLETSPWRDANIAPLAHEPDEAERLLEAAGFRDSNGDGLREEPEGNGLQAAVACMDLPVPLQIAELVAGYLKAIGIDSHVDPVAQDAWMPTLMQARFGIALHAIAVTGSETALLHFGSSHGALDDERVSGQNFGGYASPQFDEAATAAVAEPEPTAQWELAGQIQNILAADLPQIALYTPRVLSLFRSDHFTGWRTMPGHGLLHRATVSSLTPVTAD